MLKRALITGVLSTGVDVADLRVLPSAVNRHLLKSENFDAGVHIGVNATDPEVVAIQFYERPGIQLTAALQKQGASVPPTSARSPIRRAPPTATRRTSCPGSTSS
jgi:phosphomannomutase